MPLTIFNLSKVDHLYIGRDTMVTFAEEPTIDTYHIELAGEESAVFVFNGIHHVKPVSIQQAVNA